MKKIAIFRGHNTPHNTGAVGIRKEDELINEVAFPLMKKLREFGYNVVDCTPTTDISTVDSLRRRCDKANAENVDFVISIHFNATIGGYGTEVLYVSEAGKKIAEPIQNEIVKLGYRDRGLKYRSNLYVLNHTVAPICLIECAFVDSLEDMKRFNAEDMANAIFKGITGKTYISPSKPIVTPSKPIPPTPKPQPVQPKVDQNVLALQKLCNSLGVKDSQGNKLVEDGIKGSKSIEAVSKLPLCGIKYTQRLATKYIQNRLNQLGYKGADGKVLTIDGVYFTNVAYAVGKYQESKKLVSDKIIGKLGWLSFLG